MNDLVHDNAGPAVGGTTDAAGAAKIINDALMQKSVDEMRANLIRDNMARQAPIKLGMRPLVVGQNLNISGVTCKIKRIKLPGRVDLKVIGDKCPARGTRFGFGPPELGHLWFEVTGVQRRQLVCRIIPQAEAVKLQVQEPAKTKERMITSPFYKAGREQQN